MLARDLAAPYPTVRMTTSAREATQLLAERQLPGLVVVDEYDHPIAILPGSQVLRMLIPRYVQDDPALARVLDEEYADKICDLLDEHTVADMLPKDRKKLPVVGPDATVLEIAAIMAANRSPVVAVAVERSRTAPMIGAISAATLLDRLLRVAPAGGVSGAP